MLLFEKLQMRSRYKYGFGKLYQRLYRQWELGTTSPYPSYLIQFLSQTNSSELSSLVLFFYCWNRPENTWNMWSSCIPFTGRCFINASNNDRSEMFAVSRKLLWRELGFQTSRWLIDLWGNVCLFFLQTSNFNNMKIMELVI